MLRNAGKCVIISSFQRTELYLGHIYKYSRNREWIARLPCFMHGTVCTVLCLCYGSFYRKLQAK